MGVSGWRRSHGRGGEQLQASQLDLTNDWEVLLRLLEDPDAWRIRVVEQLTVGSARFCTRHRSLQAAPLHPLLGEVAHGHETAYIALPIERLPKGPLLAYDVTVDGQPAYVAPRGATAEVEAAHVINLAVDEGVDTDDVTGHFLRAICEFTPWPWKSVRSRHPLSTRRAMWTYLQEGLAPISLPERAAVGLGLWARARRLIEAGVTAAALTTALWLRKKFPGLRGRYAWIPRPPKTPFALTLQQVKDLRVDAQAVGGCLRSALGEGASRTSSADNPLLAAPLLAQGGHVASLQDLIDALKGLRAFVEALAEQVEHPRHSPALVALADFGRRWETIVSCEVHSIGRSS